MAARRPAAEDGPTLPLILDPRPPETHMNALLSHLRRSAPARFNPAVLATAALPSRAAAPPAPARVGLPTPATPLPAGVAAPAPDAALPADPGCGWFESSWDLQQGLRVSEWPDSDGPVAALWFATLAAGAGSAALQ